MAKVCSCRETATNSENTVFGPGRILLYSGHQFNLDVNVSLGNNVDAFTHDTEFVRKSLTVATRSLGNRQLMLDATVSINLENDDNMSRGTF